MILVDTSIWIDHLRSGSPALAALLQTDAVCTHDFVIGELACGNLRKRAEVLSLLRHKAEVERLGKLPLNVEVASAARLYRAASVLSVMLDWPSSRAN